MSACTVRYKNKSYGLTGQIYPNGYYVYRNSELKLTKNPTAVNVLELIDADGSKAADLTYGSGQKKSTAYAWFGENTDGVSIWLQTYTITPGAENIYQQFKSCPTGKVINPSTGNCINFYEDEALPDCPAGKFRNPETNRCKSYEVLGNILAPCKDGYYRNPETNRCKKIGVATAAGLAPCKDGYERSPETNRCRKIRENNGADYGIEPATYSEESSFVAYGALGAVVLGGLSYLVFQFRGAMAKFFGKLSKRRGRIKV